MQLCDAVATFYTKRVGLVLNEDEITLQRKQELTFLNVGFFTGRCLRKQGQGRAVKQIVVPSFGFIGSDQKRFPITMYIFLYLFMCSSNCSCFVFK